jgi:hypothetical protein
VDGWESWQRHTSDGAIEAEQRVALGRPVVDYSAAGAERLGRTYWREVRRVTRSLVGVDERDGAVALRLLRRGPVLLRFGRPALEADGVRAACTYPIAGGLLTRRPGGEIAFEQTSTGLRSTIHGFFPRIAFYDRLQGRAHVAVSRRYFRRLIAEASA